MPDTVLISTPFHKAVVAKVWRRLWNLTFGMPALSSTRLSILLKLSGEMGRRWEMGTHTGHWFFLSAVSELLSLAVRWLQHSKSTLFLRVLSK